MKLSQGPIAAMFALSLCLQSAVAQGPLDLGAALFNGVGDTGITATVGGSARVSASRFPCRSCHGRDASGGREGGAPPITGPDLFRATASRPAYTPETFRSALVEGRASDGRRFANTMPRYGLNEAALESLSAYLGEIATLQKAGIKPRSITFGVAAVSDNLATAKRYAAALDAALRVTVGLNGINGRQINVAVLEGSPAQILAQAEETAAVIGLPPSSVLDVAAFTDRQIPILFPLFPLSGMEEPALVRGVMADRRETVEAIASRIRSDKIRMVSVIQHPKCGDGAAEFARRNGQGNLIYQIVPASLTSQVETGPEVATLVICSDRPTAREILGQLPRNANLYGIASDLIIPVKETRRSAILAIPEATLTKGKGAGPMLQAHAMVSARLLVSAMETVGRDMNRTRLVAAIGLLQDPELNMRFSANALNGTSDVSFVETTSGDLQ